MPQLWHRDTNIKELFKLQLYSSFSCFAYNFHKTHSLTSTFFLLVNRLTLCQSPTGYQRVTSSTSTGMGHLLTGFDMNVLGYYMQQHIHKAYLHSKLCTKAAFIITEKMQPLQKRKIHCHGRHNIDNAEGRRKRSQ